MNIDIEREELWDFEYAAKRCGVSVKTIRNHADGTRKPRLETRRAGRQIRTTASALNKWLADCKRIYGGTEVQETRAERRTSENDTDEVELLRNAHGI